MYRVIRPQGLDTLEKNLNQIVIENPDYNCKIIQYADKSDGWMRVAFCLTKIPLEEQLNKIGEFKVVKCEARYDNNSGIPDFEIKLNLMNLEEGWRLDQMSSIFPLAIFCRDVGHKLKQSGFDNVEELRVFEQSGSPTRAIFKEHQQTIVNYLIKVEEIHQDAERDYQQKRFGDYIRLAYLETEKIAEALYCVPYHSKDTHGHSFSDIINGLGHELGVQLVDVKALMQWREVRNRFVHENLKVPPQKAQKAKAFFDETTVKLKNLLKHIPYSGKLGINLDDFKKREEGGTDDDWEMDEEEDENSNDDIDDD